VQCAHAEHPEMDPFSSVAAYNPKTTVQPVICQFRKKAHLISHVFAVNYKKVKI
jgi:hypothetical protein